VTTPNTVTGRGSVMSSVHGVAATIVHSPRHSGNVRVQTSTGCLPGARPA
jgi:hypothetical protein